MEEEGLEGGELDKGGEGTKELVLVKLQLEEGSEVPDSIDKVPTRL